MVAFAHPQRSGLNDALTQDEKGPSMADVSLRFQILTCGRVGYARVSGPLDLEAIPPFRKQVHRLFEHGCRTLILDLSGAQFLDSQGAKALLSLRDEAEKRGARLRVVVPKGSRVERTLHLLHFDSLFSIFSSASAAWRRRLSRDGRRERAHGRGGDKETTPR
jgi:anti-sigma B factor antagonist